MVELSSHSVSQVGGKCTAAWMSEVVLPTFVIWRRLLPTVACVALLMGRTAFPDREFRIVAPKSRLDTTLNAPLTNLRPGLITTIAFHGRQGVERGEQARYGRSHWQSKCV